MSLAIPSAYMLSSSQMYSRNVALCHLPIFMIWVSLPYVSNSWQILEGSSEVGGIPGVFLLKTLIPLTGALLFCQGIAGVAAILLAKLR